MSRIPIRQILAFLFLPSFHLNPLNLRVAKRQIIELLFSILIICILVSVSIPTLIDCRLRAKMSHATGEVNKEIDMFVFHSINGSWPQTNNQLEIFRSNLGFNYSDSKDNSYYSSAYIKNLTLEKGAIHILFKEELEGKTLSLRPAVQETNPTGPVILVCNKEKPGWILAGTDKTDIDDRLISRFLR